jgi:hypothetical protein
MRIFAVNPRFADLAYALGSPPLRCYNPGARQAARQRRNLGLLGDI